MASVSASEWNFCPPIFSTGQTPRPAYPVCPHWSWRGGRCPPSEPPASRAAAGAPGGPGAPPPDPRTGALTAQRRTVVVAAHLTPADQIAFGEAEALRLQMAPEPGHNAVSGLGERWLDGRPARLRGPRSGRRRRRPPPSPAAKAGSWPSRRDESRRRRGLGATPEPETTGVTSAGFPGRRSSVRRGVAPSPAPRPKCGEWIRRHAAETQRGQRVSRTVARDGYATKYETSGGLSLFRTNVAPRVTPVRANNSPASGRCRAWPRTRCRPSMLVGGGPLPQRGGSRADGGAPGSRSKVRSFLPVLLPVGLVVPNPARPSSPRWPRAVRLQSRGWTVAATRASVEARYQSRIPAGPNGYPAAAFDSGLPAHYRCVAGSDAHFWGSRITDR